LRTIITEAKRRGVDVIIATVLPILPTSRLYQPGNTDSRIQALNTQIFALSNEYNLGPPVDLFAMFKADASLISDGPGADAHRRSVPGRDRAALRREVDDLAVLDSLTLLYFSVNIDAEFRRDTLMRSSGATPAARPAPGEGERELKFTVPDARAHIVRGRLQSICRPDSEFPSAIVWTI
jgi:hypothetical protein